ncbi:conserved Plasmodium protein, unknown function [Plasmodium malariae]|uniref:Uncharacterized protein n=1 Tax=Plasmodium malariae TaxID=5858 RepID=A0A1A8WV61_PLAMA|nr:conserved Plasmodium protein, unknown function [Plasmodium malariae]
MYELKSVGNRSDDYDDCDSTRESKILDMEEGESIKKGDIYTKKVSISSSNFFVGNNKSTSNGEKKMKQISDSKTFKRKVTTKDIVNCPKEYHANFISMFLFIIGSAFFRFPILYVAGCIIFAIASAMCLYSNLISAIRFPEHSLDAFKLSILLNWHLTKFPIGPSNIEDPPWIINQRTVFVNLLI